MKPTIHFFKEEIRFRLLHARHLPSWVNQVITGNKKKTGVINYIFCNDAHLHSMNKQYLGHSTYTDIITFNTSDNRDLISGDIFISVERVRSNAQDYKTNFNDELHRVMIHGILHLIGYRDKNASEKNRMRAKEDECLAMKKF